MAECRIRIQTPTFDQNGSCHVAITRDNRFRLTVSTLLGGMFLAIYQDADQIQVLNYHNATYLHLKNSEMNRYKAFEIVNLNVAEFRSIFWGREIEGESTGLRFVYEGGRPIEIRKPMPRSDQLITIRKWLLYHDALFPRSIEFNDRNRDIYMKVVVTSFSPGLSAELVPAKVPESFQLRK
ncbi:MAG: DUF4292 domain-containing protein [SAR324 cluster bacterium]|nr:DUF4292 domain-containing protein [SAR324 cluster bacterium]